MRWGGKYGKRAFLLVEMHPCSVWVLFLHLSQPWSGFQMYECDKNPIAVQVQTVARDSMNASKLQ